MKRFFCTLILIATVFSTASAEYALKKKKPVNSAPDDMKVIGFAPGVRLSLLGIEPTFAIDILNLELEAACAISTGVTGDRIGVAPSFCIAYNSDPFGDGVSATFGLEYMFLSSSYMRVLGDVIDSDDMGTDPNIHGISLFYRGDFKITRFAAFCWRIRFPLFIGWEGDDGFQSINVTNLPGLFGCGLISICTVGIGVRFSF